MIGRIRTVKPEIFSDEKLWDLSLETGLPLLQAFEGLWCYADREGRFEWRPRALKTLILPYWEGDFARALEALERGRYVVRYVVDGQVFGYVRNFAKHQRVNAKEQASILPAPPVVTRGNPGVSPVSDPAPPVNHPDDGEGNGRELEGKGREGDRASATPSVPGLTIVAEPEDVIRVIPGKGRFAPENLEPTMVQRVRCRELRFDAGELMRDFKLQEFNRDYTDWEKRFSRWIEDQKVQRETEQAKPKSGPRSAPADIDTTGAALAFRLDSEHREFATKMGRRSDLDAFAREYAQGESCKRLDTLGQSRDFMNRLKCLAHTGQWHPDGPLPKPPVKAREVRA